MVFQLIAAIVFVTGWLLVAIADGMGIALVEGRTRSACWAVGLPCMILGFPTLFVAVALAA